MTNRAIDWLDRMNELAGADGFALALAVKATLLVLLGAAAVFALSRAGAATRHLGWALTVAGLLALPALLAWAPALDLPVLPGDENPLIQAAGGSHLEVVRYLMDTGADPNVRVTIPPNPWHPDGDVRTPLSMARRGGHRGVVELLESRGARE